MDWMKISQRLVMVGQLGLSLLMPLLLCMGACYLLNTRLGLGLWIYFFGFLLGFGGSIMTAYHFWVSVSQKAKEEGDAQSPAFNRHN